MKTKDLFILLFLIIGIFSCKKEKIEPVKVVVNNDVKFSTEIYPIFASYSCTGCHGTSGGLTLTGTASETVTSLKNSNTPAVIPNNSAGSKFYSFFAGGASHMGKTLTTQETANIKEWIDQGAQDN